MSQKTWREAIDIVLNDEKAPLRTSEIADRIISRQLRTSLGATPADTVSSVLSSDIKRNPETTLYVWTDKNTYCLKKYFVQASGEIGTSDDESASTREDILTCFGMYWKRDAVDWQSKSILGWYGKSAKKVNFWDQIGIYILYDEQRVIYVGRAAERSIGQRLKEHTEDRLNGRWNRFSWFGLNRITDEGNIISEPLPVMDASQLIALLESLLIEALEPGQNRKRGDQLNEIEYLQVANVKDPLREQLRRMVQEIS